VTYAERGLAGSRCRSRGWSAQDTQAAALQAYQRISWFAVRHLTQGSGKISSMAMLTKVFTASSSSSSDRTKALSIL
jgi:hypothetical protein